MRKSERRSRRASGRGLGRYLEAREAKARSRRRQVGVVVQKLAAAVVQAGAVELRRVRHQGRTCGGAARPQQHKTSQERPSREQGFRLERMAMAMVWTGLPGDSSPAPCLLSLRHLNSFPRSTNPGTT